MSRKPRADSFYDTLPPATQQTIAEHALKHTLEETLAWHQSGGMAGGSVTALSRWLAGWRLREQMDRNASIVQQALDDAKRNNPEITQDQLFSLGQSLFSGMAIEQQDPQIWLATQRLELEKQTAEARWKLEREKLDQAERKIVLLEKKAAAFDQVKASVNSGGLTPETLEKIERELKLM